MKYLQEVVDSGLGRGRETMVERFERAFARELGIKHFIGTPGCAPALAVLACAWDYEPGDEIIVSPITDFGTIQGLIGANYIPVFPDTLPCTVNFGAETIEPCITQRTRAILAVHMTGVVCDMDPIRALAARYGLEVYEDACQAVFSEYKGRVAGTLGRAAAFSFDSEKTMGADMGGGIATDDDELAERIRFVGHSRGAVVEPGFGRQHILPGLAHRMPLCTAAICLAQLEIIREQVAWRDRMVRLLTSLIAEIPGIRPLTIPQYLNVYSAWMFSLSIDPAQFSCDAESFAEQLVSAGIAGAGTGKYYLMPAGAAFLEPKARSNIYPFSVPPASREYHYGTDTCPQAWKFLQTWIRWATFCEKYTESHCELAARLVREVADRNRR
jgi:dTDP-4-amino-4,6-dideoxygalactose transaminase